MPDLAAFLGSQMPLLQVGSFGCDTLNSTRIGDLEGNRGLSPSFCEGGYTTGTYLKKGAVK